jgi:hypothetical protein
MYLYEGEKLKTKGAASAVPPGLSLEIEFSYNLFRH